MTTFRNGDPCPTCGERTLLLLKGSAGKRVIREGRTVWRCADMYCSQPHLLGDPPAAESIVVRRGRIATPLTATTPDICRAAHGEIAWQVDLPHPVEDCHCVVIIGPSNDEPPPVVQ